jgi:hypothetical protein
VSYSNSKVIFKINSLAGKKLRLPFLWATVIYRSQQPAIFFGSKKIDHFAVLGAAPDERTLTTFLRISNQNGAPWAAARPVMSRPTILISQPVGSFNFGVFVTG